MIDIFVLLFCIDTFYVFILKRLVSITAYRSENYDDNIHSNKWQYNS